MKREGAKWAAYGPSLGGNGGPGICKYTESTVRNYKEIMVSNQEIIMSVYDFCLVLLLIKRTVKG